MAALRPLRNLTRICLAACLAAVPSAARGQEARLPSVSGGQVAAAVKAGLDYLYGAQKPDGSWATRYSQPHPGGVESLVVLTALTAGRKDDEPALAKAIQYLNSVWPETVYARSLRAMVYARLVGPDSAKRLREDAVWLAKQQSVFGGWGYGPQHPVTLQQKAWVDNSNTQLAALALHEAARAGAPVPPMTWSRLRALWPRAQNGDGGWGYTPPGDAVLRLKTTSYGSMTAAGVATARLLAAELAAAEGRGEGDSPDVRKQIESMLKGLRWLGAHYDPKTNPEWLWGEQDNWSGYYLYCLTRAAEAAGIRTLAGRDWAAEVVAGLLDAQNKDGSWSDPTEAGRQGTIARTCFSLMALVHAGKGVLFNKMSLPGTEDAADDPYLDAGNLARWFGVDTGAPVAWQLVPQEAPAAVLAEAPLLYVVCGPGAKFPASAPLAHYIRNGGTVLVQAAGPQQALAWQGFFLGLLPDYHAERLGDNHPVFGDPHKVHPAARPEAIGIGDYCRTRIFILPNPTVPLWRAGAGDRTLPAFEFFGNLAMYATDGARPPGRFAPRRAGATPGKTVARFQIARIRHNGDWNTNPLAFARLGEVLAAAASLAVEEAPPVDLARGDDIGLGLLWLTGSVPAQLAAPQRQNLKAYVEGGGMVFLDPAVGGADFFEVAKKMLEETFGPSAVKLLTDQHPIITGSFGDGMGSDLRQVRYSAAVTPKAPGLNKPVLYGMELNGRLAVVLSRYGVTCPLEGNVTYGCMGLSTDDARRLAANVVLYAASR